MVFSYPLLALRPDRAHVPQLEPNVTTYVVLSGFLSSEPGEPNKDDLFRLQKPFGSASGKCLYYITCSYPLGGVVINVLA